MDKLSIIIPALNEERYIGNILSDLTGQTKPAYEIIVVDGGSSDSTHHVVSQFAGVHLIKTKPNPAHQRDRGAQKARGDILVFLDADTRISADFLKNVKKKFASKEVSVACPQYYPEGILNSSWILYAFFNAIFWTVQKVFPCGAGSCIIIRKETYHALGGFEEKYTFDDMHLLSKANGKGIFAILPFRITVSDRRIKSLGLSNALLLYLRLSWYFIKGDFEGANRVHYPFLYKKKR